MCWMINKVVYDKNPEKYHKVAEEDKIVYNFGYVDNNIFQPCYSMTSYEPNKIKRNKKLILNEPQNGVQIIEKGYDSFCGDIFCTINDFYWNFRTVMDGEITSDEKTLLFFSWGEENVSSAKVRVGKFIIPRGTEYYENEDGEIISSKIMWNGESMPLKCSKRKKIKDYINDNK